MSRGSVRRSLWSASRATRPQRFNGLMPRKGRFARPRIATLDARHAGMALSAMTRDLAHSSLDGSHSKNREPEISLLKGPNSS